MTWRERRAWRRRTLILAAISEGVHYGAELWVLTGVRAGALTMTLHELLADGVLRDEWEAQPDGRPSRRAYYLASPSRRS